jgi:hypothetical protein
MSTAASSAPGHGRLWRPAQASASGPAAGCSAICRQALEGATCRWPTGGSGPGRGRRHEGRDAPRPTAAWRRDAGQVHHRVPAAGDAQRLASGACRRPLQLDRAHAVQASRAAGDNGAAQEPALPPRASAVPRARVDHGHNFDALCGKVMGGVPAVVVVGEDSHPLARRDSEAVDVRCARRLPASRRGGRFPANTIRPLQCAGASRIVRLAQQCARRRCRGWCRAVARRHGRQTRSSAAYDAMRHKRSENRRARHQAHRPAWLSSSAHALRLPIAAPCDAVDLQIL